MYPEFYLLFPNLEGAIFGQALDQALASLSSDREEFCSSFGLKFKFSYLYIKTSPSVEIRPNKTKPVFKVT